MKRISILGSTGSIGTQALDIARKNPDKFNICALTCSRSIDRMCEQIKEFRPELVCVSSEKDAAALSDEFPHVTVMYGEEGLKEAARIECDMVLNSLLGISGLVPTVHAAEAGRDIAFANKETLVTGGRLIMELVRNSGIRLLPVDSEHSAIFQCLEGNAGRKIRRIILTASGGPFRGYDRERLENVTLEQTLKHPNWTMGQKITVDSATMMNKGFEVIEAKWLFDVNPQMIDVLVHPQSIIHSAVEFEDTSVIAQMGKPDMRVPISYAFSYPERIDSGLDSLDFTELSALTFEKPDPETFRCLGLAYEALAADESHTVALNGANEVLTAEFLKKNIRYIDIQNILEEVMERHQGRNGLELEDIIEEDKTARELTLRIIRGRNKK